MKSNKIFYRIIPNYDEKPTEIRIEAYIKKKYEHRYIDYHVGCLYAKINNDYIVFINNLYVDPHFRQKGIASTMNELMLEELQRLDNNTVLITKTYDEYVEKILITNNFKKVLSEDGFSVYIKYLRRNNGNT